MKHDCSELDPETKRLVKQRDGYECQLCGRVGEPRFPACAPEYQDEPVSLTTHHKIPRSKGGSDKLENLITICKRDHDRHHHNPAPPSDYEPGVDHRTVSQLVGLPDPESTDAEVFATVARRGPVRTGHVAEAVDISSEHARRVLYRLGARDLVVPTGDGGWDLIDRVPDPPIGELPDDPGVAAVRIRDEMLRRAAEVGVDESVLAELADLSPRTIRIAVDRAATYAVPLPRKADVSGGRALPSRAGPRGESEGDDVEVWGDD